MIRFYELTYPEQTPGTAVVAAEDTDASILLRWVPNTGLWHRDGQLENDFLFGDDGGTFTEITPEDAAGLLGKVQRLDTRRSAAQRVLARFESLPADEQRTSAQLGLSAEQTGHKPMKAPGLPTLLRKMSKRRRWTTVNVYGGTAGSAPRQFVSAWDGKTLDPADPPLEARRINRKSSIITQARIARATASKAPSGVSETAQGTRTLSAGRNSP